MQVKNRDFARNYSSLSRMQEIQGIGALLHRSVCLQWWSQVGAEERLSCPHSLYFRFFPNSECFWSEIVALIVALLLSKIQSCVLKQVLFLEVSPFHLLATQKRIWKDMSLANTGGQLICFIMSHSSNRCFEARSTKERSAISLIYSYIWSTTHELLNSGNGVHNNSNDNSSFRMKIYVVKLHCFKLVNLNIHFT